jgi:hypothetical protein
MPDCLRTRLALTILALAAISAGLVAPAARAEHLRPVYIALGDSYTSAPLSSKPVGEWGGPNGYNNPDDPYTCGRSDRNYPHLLAQHLSLYDPDDLVAEAGEHPAHPGLIDISCGSATTHDLWFSQTGLPGGGEAPPQFTAFDRVGLDEVVTLVSIGIGGNDLGFGELTDKCVQSPHMPGGKPCHEHYENNGNDILRARLVTLRGELDRALAEIHRRAPQAEVLVYGYPALLPEYRDGCYPYIPILPADAAYLRGVEKDLNGTIRDAAVANDAHYVDWYSPSIGHDMCTPPGTAWVNGIVLAPPSYPVHPNVLGTRGAANAGIGVLNAIDYDFERAASGD